MEEEETGAAEAASPRPAARGEGSEEAEERPMWVARLGPVTAIKSCSNKLNSLRPTSFSPVMTNDACRLRHVDWMTLAICACRASEIRVRVLRRATRGCTPTRCMPPAHERPHEAHELEAARARQSASDASIAA